MMELYYCAILDGAPRLCTVPVVAEGPKTLTIESHGVRRRLDKTQPRYWRCYYHTPEEAWDALEVECAVLVDKGRQAHAMLDKIRAVRGDHPHG